MGESNSRIHNFVALCDDLMALGKDVGIVVILILFFFFGSFLHDKLDALGIAELGPVKLKEVQDSNKKVRDAASSMSTLQQKITDLEVLAAQGPSNTPSGVKGVSSWKNEIAALKTQATTADQSIKTTLLAQQDVLQKASQTVDTGGWMYAGQVDETKKAWSGLGAKNLASPPATPDFQPGQTYTLASDVYLHQAAPGGQWHTQGDVSSVLKQGNQVQIVDVDMNSHARSGGYFVWLKIKQV